MSAVTRLLEAAAAADRLAAADLLPLVYDELRKLAAARMAAELPGHTLDATALVHEAYLRLVGDQHFDGRGHFFAAAAEAMRRILVNHARDRNRQKRTGGRARLELLDQVGSLADDLDGAIAAYREAVRLGIGGNLPYILQGSALLRKGDVDGAIKEHRESVRKYPESGEGHRQLGHALYCKGDLDGAIAEYREAVRLDPKSSAAIESVVAALAKKGSVEEAIAEYARLDPKSERHHVLSRVAVALLRAGKFAGVQTLIGQMIAGRQETAYYSHSLAFLGEALVEWGKVASAEPVLRDCLALREKLTPDEWWTAYTESFLGEALARQKKYAEAEPRLIHSYRRLTTLYPPREKWNRSVPDRRHATAAQLARLYEATGKLEEAASWRTEAAKCPLDVAPRPRVKK